MAEQIQSGATKLRSKSSNNPSKQNPAPPNRRALFQTAEIKDLRRKGSILQFSN